jgi:DNA-binding transcriptional MerR regulator
MYTVKQLAQLAGVSIRTLHHYDEVGLLKPVRNNQNGYRYYGEKELLRLQQILFFRELEFSLDEIKSILDSPQFDQHQALENQYQLLTEKKNRLTKILKTISKTINTLEGGEKMTDQELYEGLSTEQIEAYKKEAQERWGHTEAYRQSQERVAKWTREDWNRLKAESGAILTQLAELMDQPVTNAQVQDLIGRYHQHMNNFYDCSIEIYAGLGKMYIQDERFKATYEKIKPGLAQFISEGIAHYCQNNKT